MSYIYTSTAKWDDAWFSELSNDAKVLFYYISEKCNNAGFYEINKKTLLVQTNMNDVRLRECFIEIKKAYIMSSDKTTLWLKNYLKHQRKLPLKDSISNHRQIINMLKLKVEDKDKFYKRKEILDLFPNTEKIKRSPIVKIDNETVESVKRFVKPTVDEVKEYMDLKSIPNSLSESQNFFNFYESKGWKVGKNPMKSWKSAIDGTWAKGIRDRNKDKFSVLENGYESNKSIDWNEKIKN